jgi:hypothetical protein
MSEQPGDRPDAPADLERTIVRRRDLRRAEAETSATGDASEPATSPRPEDAPGPRRAPTADVEPGVASDELDPDRLDETIVPEQLTATGGGPLAATVPPGTAPRGSSPLRTGGLGTAAGPSALPPMPIAPAAAAPRFAPAPAPAPAFAATAPEPTATRPAAAVAPPPRVEAGARRDLPVPAERASSVGSTTGAAVRIGSAVGQPTLTAPSVAPHAVPQTLDDPLAADDVTSDATRPSGPVVPAKRPLGSEIGVLPELEHRDETTRPLWKHPAFVVSAITTVLAVGIGAALMIVSFTSGGPARVSDLAIASGSGNVRLTWSGPDQPYSLYVTGPDGGDAVDLSQLVRGHEAWLPRTAGLFADDSCFVVRAADRSSDDVTLDDGALDDQGAQSVCVADAG